MNVKPPRHRICRKYYLLLLAIIAWGFACGPATMVDMADSSKNRNVTAPKMITSIVTTEEADGVGILLKSDRLLTATSIKQPYPLGVILYLPETVAPDLKTIYTPDSDIVKSVRATKLTDDGPGVRLEILLDKEAPYDITQENEGLKVVFKDTEGPSSLSLYGKSIKEPQSFEESDIEPIVESEQPASSTVNNIRSVSATELDESVNISVQAEGTIKDYRSSTMASPARIVFELFNVKSPHPSEQMVPVNTEWVKAVRYYSYPDRVRLVLETDKNYLNNFSAYSTDDGLLINVGSVKSPLASDDDNRLARSSVTDEPLKPGVSGKVDSQTLSQPASSAVSPDRRTLQPKTVPSKKIYRRAWVNRIDFHSTTEGRSTIIIGTTHPVKYDVNKQGDKKLKISLFNTRIPKYRRRPLITARFESAVDRITPKQKSGATDIAIMLREAVPYNVEQEGNLLKVTLEPSAIPPKPSAATAALKDNNAVSSSDDTVSMALKKDADSMILKKADDKASTATESTQKYVGEKISLDFYQTDIKNVFRILREVSKKNFAIDDNVSGKVTLTLDKPVPWDQVLELILKMNSLGMVYEGDIIRIAKLTTLVKEENDKNATIKASLKAKQAQAALEPLETDYIPINYVKASSILAQIEPVLTPERGKALIHEETHQIVITDVPDVIKNVHKIIAKLDLITEQVLIQARIVEVSTDFTRKLGIDWEAFGGIQPGSTSGVGAPGTSGKAGLGPQRGFDSLGGTYGYGMMSHSTPVMTAGTIGFSFTRLIASELLLNASLHALENTGEAKTISTPKIFTLDGVAAKIEQGDVVPTITVEDGNAVVTFEPIKLTLSVTPQVTRDARIRMNINLNYEVPKTFTVATLFGPQDTIGKATSGVTTELLVNNGDTIVVGGVRKFTSTESENRLPWLADIPVLGWLFKSQSKTDTSKELLIFITPRVVKLDQPKTQKL